MDAGREGRSKDNNREDFKVRTEEEEVWVWTDKRLWERGEKKETHKRQKER